MELTKTVNVKFTDDEMVKFIGDRVVDLEEDEEWELINAYSTLHDYTFRVVKKKEEDE